LIDAFPCPLVVPDRMYGKIGLRFLYAGMRQPDRVRQATSFSFPAGMRPYGRVSAGLPGSSFPKSSFPAEKPARPAFRGFPRKKPPVRGRETFRYLRQDFAGKGRAVPGYGQAVHFAAMVVKNNRLPRCRRTIPCRKRKTRPSGPGCPMAETGFNREKGERKIPFSLSPASRKNRRSFREKRHFSEAASTDLASMTISSLDRSLEAIIYSTPSSAQRRE